MKLPWRRVRPAENDVREERLKAELRRRQSELTDRLNYLAAEARATGYGERGNGNNRKS